MKNLPQARLFRTEYYTHRDKKTGQIDHQVACHVWVFPDWSYKLIFETII